MDPMNFGHVPIGVLVKSMNFSSVPICLLVSVMEYGRTALEWWGGMHVYLLPSLLKVLYRVRRVSS